MPLNINDTMGFFSFTTAKHEAVERANPSLGVAESAFVRRLNERVNNGVLANEHYRELVRELLAHRTLTQRTESPRLMLPPDVHPWARDLTRSWVEEVKGRGYDVIGDLEDLLGGMFGGR